MKITSRWYGVTRDGQAVTEYTFQNRQMSVSVLNYGGIIRRILVPDREGRLTDVVLGYDSLAGYEGNGAHFGALVGRYANRIENAAFELNGKRYTLAKNSGAHHLHGPFSHMALSARISGGGLCLRGFSPAAQEGFPGDLTFSVTYTLSDDNVLGMVYDAETTEDTVLNLTNHSYFNLSGHASGKVFAQELQLSASRFLENNDTTCPTGEILSVAQTPFDFRRLAPIGQGFPIRDEQMEFAGGYDHCYILDEDAEIAAIAHSPRTGITLEVVTTQPGVQLYTGNFLGDDPTPGKEGCLYRPQGAFCLETQHFPCSPSHPEFPSTVLRRGEHYHEATLLKFLTLK